MKPPGARSWPRLSFDWAKGPGFGVLFRTTTFRLALAQALVFTAFAFVLLAYVYFATVGQFTRDADEAADQEYAALAQIYSQSGINRLNQEVVERAAAEGPALYALGDQSGKIISGDFNRLPVIPAHNDARVRFAFQTRQAKGMKLHGARGRVGRLLGGPILLVARDMGDATNVISKISQAIWAGMALGLLFSLVSGLIASRQAARRAEALSRTARDVMRGDLSRRAPQLGFGDEFDALSGDLNAMLARIERLVQSSRTAGDAIAHDLRTPLARLRQRLEAALEAPAGTEADREALRRALDEADQLLATFNAVLRLARVQSAENWTFQTLDVAATAAELAEFYQPAAEEQGLAFSAELEQKLDIRGEPNLITQALANLIENALKYTPAGGRVRLSANRRSDGRIVVAVADSGQGVPVEERDRITERFVRLEQARSTPGAGLGLSLVAAVAELHGAQLLLQDGLGDAESPGLSAALAFKAV